jgi:hypothetical protein
LVYKCIMFVQSCYFGGWWRRIVLPRKQIPSDFFVKG